MYAPLVDLCTCALLDQGSDACFWVDGVRSLFPVDQLGTVGQQLVDNPPSLLAKRFPGLIDSLVEEIKGDLKAKTDSLIREAVSRRVRRFSEEVASVEELRKTLVTATNEVEVIVVEEDSVSKLKNDIVLIFLRYKRMMLQELRSSVRDRLVGRVSLRETCAERRLEIISREQALHRAKEGISQLLGLTTQEERQEWEKAGETGGLPDDKDPSNSNLEGSDLSGINLSGFDLRGADFSEANLHGADLSRFERCDLSGVNLSSADLSGAKILNANLKGANLSNAQLLGADLSSCDLSGVDLSSADLDGANLSNATMKSVNLTNANLLHANLPAWGSGLLEGVKLAGAAGWVPADKDLSKAKLKGADLSSCHLSGINLSSADLSSADLSNAKLQGAVLKGADLSKCDLSGADLTGADLSEANLQGTILRDASLCAAIFHTAQEEEEILLDLFG